MAAGALCLGAAGEALVQVGALQAATALHRCILHPTPGVRPGQGETGVVARLHVVIKLQVVLTGYLG